MIAADKYIFAVASMQNFMRMYVYIGFKIML